LKDPIVWGYISLLSVLALAFWASNYFDNNFNVTKNTESEVNKGKAKLYVFISTKSSDLHVSYLADEDVDDFVSFMKEVLNCEYLGEL